MSIIGKLEGVAQTPELLPGRTRCGQVGIRNPKETRQEKERVFPHF